MRAWGGRDAGAIAGETNSPELSKGRVTREAAGQVRAAESRPVAEGWQMADDRQAADDQRRRRLEEIRVAEAKDLVDRQRVRSALAFRL